MKYFVAIDDEIIAAVYANDVGENEITEAEYNAILDIVHNKPKAPDGYDYRLKADTLEWELYELPEPEPVDEEATVEDYEEALAEVGI